MGQTCHVGQKCSVPAVLHPICRPGDTQPNWTCVDEAEEGGDAISLVAKDRTDVAAFGSINGGKEVTSEAALLTTKIEVRHVENMEVPNGGVFTGEVSQVGQPQGQGLQRWADGTVYRGSWHLGAAHGKGELRKPDNSGYCGQWVEGRKHGLGHEWLIDGSQYQGEFADGQKHGHGCFQWKGGASYTGQFCEDMLQGEGVFLWGDGRTYHGQWVQSRMHGQGRFEWPDGKSFEGKYENDQKHGSGVFMWPDGSKILGVWQSGKQHGPGTHVTAKGVMRRGRWKNGNLEQWVVTPPESGRADFSSTDASIVHADDRPMAFVNGKTPSPRPALRSTPSDEILKQPPPMEAFEGESNMSNTPEDQEVL